MREENELTIPEIKTKHMTLTIVGDTDLVLNKMNAPTERALTDARKDKAKKTEKPNYWEEVITSVHWVKPIPKDTEFNEDMYNDLIQNNAPCITAFGLKQSLCDAVVRNEIDKFSTKFKASVNVKSIGGNIPIMFGNAYIDEKLMSPKKGAPVLAKLNRFSTWCAEIDIDFLDNVYSAEQIISIINLAGFGIGIGSGRSSGYGRYHVNTDNVKIKY